jgi:protein gp37
MGKDSKIEWTDHTFNVVWGCTKVSEECAHCYAEAMAKRTGLGWRPNAPRKVMGPAYWHGPLKWDRAAALAGERRRVFCSSMADVFEDHPTVHRERARLWPLIRATANLDWLLLTKRPGRIALDLPPSWGDGWPNVWLGTTAGLRARFDERVPILRAIPAAVRFLSCEPLLGDLGRVDLSGIDWLIVGGESGPRFRPMAEDWVRSIRDQCRESGVSFFYKQASGYRPEKLPMLDGRRWTQFPAPRPRKARVP